MPGIVMPREKQARFAGKCVKQKKKCIWYGSESMVDMKK